MNVEGKGLNVVFILWFLMLQPHGVQLSQNNAEKIKFSV